MINFVRNCQTVFQHLNKGFFKCKKEKVGGSLGGRDEGFSDPPQVKFSGTTLIPKVEKIKLTSAS